MRLQIGVIGPEERNLKEGLKEKFLSLAEEIGKLLALKGVTLVTGGCSGVAEAASKGAYENGGITVATPGRKRKSSVPYTTVEVCTPIGIGDYLFAGTLSCDAIIVFPGDAGTLAELAIAYRNKKPLIFIEDCGENLLEELFTNVPKDYPKFLAKNAKEAVDLAIKIAQDT